MHCHESYTKQPELALHHKTNHLFSVVIANWSESVTNQANKQKNQLMFWARASY